MKIPVTPIKGNNNKRAIPEPSYKPIENLNKSKIIFSFEILDINHEYFNLGGTCQKWFVTLFTKLNEISKIPFGELISGKHKTFRFHSHNGDKISVDFPFDVAQSDTRQIRFGTGQGGVHGLLIDNMFYVLWLDRHHNLYPSERYGGTIIKLKEQDCCGYDIEMIKELNEKISDLEEEIKIYEEIINEIDK